jgi:hypothetical protein
VVGQMRRGLDHAAGCAGRADAATLAGVSDQEVVSAVGAAGTGEAVDQDAAFKVAAEFPLGDGGCACPGAILLKRQPCGQMRQHLAIEQRALGLTTAVDGTAR